ncbi:Dynamin-related protein 3A isoform B [Glycine soja]|uniref:Dynamin-related protein 3A isoform A n=1 Tax=Glycine soja TaxID=3848 RepID=A0A445HU55_GLYSO|nr:Dynamin-related protein 3A isoform A [Glycine soja]RZB77228.1 Dynamin-related protein 3A isoform B [Glycine soja]
MDEVVRKFLREDLKPLESNIAHFIEIQHALESEKGSASERSVKSWVILARRANGVVTDSGVRAASDVERVVPSGNNGGSSWGISSLFGGDDSRMTVKENIASKPHTEQPVHSKEQSFSTIHLREPPPILRPSESNSETDVVKITANKLLLRSYYDIVRKNVEDTIPKEIMYSLVLYCLILLVGFAKCCIIN